MADVTRRRQGELLRLLFAVLAPHPDGMRASDALELLAQRVTLTPHEAGTYESGARRFEKIVRWSQPVDATVASSTSAGVRQSSV